MVEEGNEETRCQKKEVEELEYNEEATRCQFLLTLNGFEPQVPRFYIHFKIFKLSTITGRKNVNSAHC